MRVRTALALCALVCAGCASTPGGMRGDPDAKRVMVIEAGYQVVLKRLVDWNAECVGGPVAPIGQVINDVQHYPDMRTASIVRGAMGVGTQIFEVIDLREISPGRTEMTFYAKASTDTRAAAKRRIAEGAGRCP